MRLVANIKEKDKETNKMPSYDLLNVDNPKTTKGESEGYYSGVLYLAPATEASDYNMCAGASPECIDDCLYNEGHARICPNVKKARIRKTLEYLADYEGFMKRLEKDAEKLIRHAKTLGLTPAFRANGTSDQPKIALRIASRFPNLQCYDYTKLDKPWLRLRPNYHLTYSFNGLNLQKCLDALKHGINVAVVFNGGLPDQWQGYRVIDGDKNDLRFLDPAGVIVGLTPKGKSKKAPVGGFIQIGKAPKPDVVYVPWFTPTLPKVA